MVSTFFATLMTHSNTSLLNPPLLFLPPPLPPATVQSHIYYKNLHPVPLPALFFSCSSDHPHLTSQLHGARAFSCTAPRLWNSMPPHNQHSCLITAFKFHLKTHLFKPLLIPKPYNLTALLFYPPTYMCLLFCFCLRWCICCI